MHSHEDPWERLFLKVIKVSSYQILTAVCRQPQWSSCNSQSSFLCTKRGISSEISSALIFQTMPRHIALPCSFLKAYFHSQYNIKNVSLRLDKFVKNNLSYTKSILITSGASLPIAMNVSPQHSISHHVNTGKNFCNRTLDTVFQQRALQYSPTTCTFYCIVLMQ